VRLPCTISAVSNRLRPQPSKRREHALTQFDKQVDALMYLLSHPSRRIIRVDELRRAIESLSPDGYARLGCYEKWLLAMRDLLVEKGVLGADELAHEMEELRARAVRGRTRQSGL
jgi:Nitrile hydratase beta subunit